MVVEHKGNSSYQGGVLLITLILSTVTNIGSTILLSDENSKPAKKGLSPQSHVAREVDHGNGGVSL